MKTKSPVQLSDYRKLSDEEVIHRYVHRHEPSAISCLYERYAHLVLGVCFKYLDDAEEAKDATQQIFIKLLEDLKRFEILRFRPWLLQVTRNHCLMQLRKKQPVAHHTVSLDEDMEFEEELHPDMEREFLIRHLEAALETLNPDQRSCIELFYLNGLNYGAISEKTNFTLMQVKSHIQNGKRNLKNKIKSAGTVQS